MPPMVQHKTPELPASDESAHALPRPLKLPAIARRNELFGRACDQYIISRTACNTAQNGYARGVVAIEIIALRPFSRGAFALKAWLAPKSPGFQAKTGPGAHSSRSARRD